MEVLSNWIAEHLHISPVFQKKLLITLLVMLTLALIRQGTMRFLRKSPKDLKVIYAWQKITSYVAYGLGLVMIAFIWMEQLQSLSTFLGLLSAGLAIALKEPVANFFGWIYIIFRKPFEMGDRIEIGPVAGDVLDISTMEFALMEIGNWVNAEQSTGRIIYVPNGKVFTEPVMNYNQAFNYIWNEIPITLTFESNWEKAKQILLDVENHRAKEFGLPEIKELRRVDHRIALRFSTLTPTVYTSIKENGILLTMRYLCHPKNRRGSAQVILEEVLKEFTKHPDIRFAPTHRLYIPPEERLPNLEGILHKKS